MTCKRPGSDAQFRVVASRGNYVILVRDSVDVLLTIVRSVNVNRTMYVKCPILNFIGGLYVFYVFDAFGKPEDRKLGKELNGA